METLIFSIVLIMLNIFFAVKPNPIMGVTVTLLTFFIGVTYLVTDTTLPLNSPNPIFTIFILILSGASLICQWYDYKKPH